MVVADCGYDYDKYEKSDPRVFSACTPEGSLTDLYATARTRGRETTVTAKRDKRDMCSGDFL